MKKFCNKITKQQWRVTVPNINSSLFKRSPKDENNRKTVSGSYDLEEAQREYDRCRTVSGGAVEPSESSDSENYEDARMSEKHSSVNAMSTDDDCELYVDVDCKTPEKMTLEGNDQPFEYDVPKISFSFLERGANENEPAEYAVVAPKTTAQHKSEVVIVLSDPQNNAQDSNSTNELVIETKSIDVCLVKDLQDFPMCGLVKSGSDPNIRYRHSKIEEEDEEEFYKVPRPTKRFRLSQSLNDFNVENVETITSAHSSIEHISCSQTLAQNVKDENGVQAGSANSESMDYCKLRSKLPLKLRRVTLLRRPKAKAADTWTNLRTKFNSMMAEHATHQRVGAFENNKEKLVLNIEDVYKSSKDKCKKVLKNTGKMFSKGRRRQGSIASSGDNSSQIVKNHAFFAKVDLKASDIEYKLNYANDSESKNGDVTDDKAGGAVRNNVGSNDQRSVSRSVSEEKKEEFDFGTIKSAFRRSKMITTEVSLLRKC